MTRRLRPLMMRLLAGILWGLIIGCAEIPILPIERLPLADQVSVVAWIPVPYIVSGALLALVFGPVAARWSASRLIPLVTISNLLLATVQVGITLWSAQRGQGAALVFGRAPEPAAIFLHGAWQQIFFGSLALAAYLLRRRADRTRAFIARAMIAARRSEAALAQASARALRGQLQPERLAEFVTAIRIRYQRDLVQGDLLLERLTDYLRAAMPGIRSGQVSPVAERETALCLRRLSEALKSAPAKARQHEDC